MALKKIENQEQFEQIQQPATFFLLKNSTTCPVSETAFEEFQNFAEDYPGVACYYLNVQEARPLSHAIEAEYDVKHESPQLLVFADQKVEWHVSHWDVTYAMIEEYWKQIS